LCVVCAVHTARYKRWPAGTRKKKDGWRAVDGIDNRYDLSAGP
jgi:hypothetical protein